MKRAYEVPSRADGRRVLIDRIWPRGVSRETLQLHEWSKDVAPSTRLRTWFAHDPTKWHEFKRRYFEELDEQPEAVARLVEAGRGRKLTLVFGAKDLLHNNAVALKDYLDQRHATPTK